MTLTEQVTKKIIKKLLAGEDYRIEIITLLNAEFLQFAIDFFKKIVQAKLNEDMITIQWYKDSFLDPSLPKNEFAINAGLNMKSISNMYNTTRKEVVIEVSKDHFEALYASIQELVDSDNDIDLTLKIQFRGVSVDLNVSESLIVINSLAVKRSALRGGLWSTAGKRVEKPLMKTLCKLFNVSENNYCIQYHGDHDEDFSREIDFYLVDEETYHKCEVKLMGRGNPESADVVIARDSKIFIADKLSDTNKTQLNSRNVEWVELRNEIGFRKFGEVLTNLNIPHTPLNENNLINDIELILDEVLT